jgi:hypothetical protein
MYLEYCFIGGVMQGHAQATKRADAAMKGPAMLRLLMRPSNAVCDAMHITDEHERGMVRMLVNMLALSLVGVLAFAVVIGSF